LSGAGTAFSSFLALGYYTGLAGATAFYLEGALFYYSGFLVSGYFLSFLTSFLTSFMTSF
jgi:hypothetical protein